MARTQLRCEKMLHVWFEVTHYYKPVARIKLVKSENPIVCVTVNCEVCRSAIALNCM
jgi:hypothetical protein